MAKRNIEPLPAVQALKRAHDEQLIAQYLATHTVQRVHCVVTDLDVRSVVPEFRDTDFGCNHVRRHGNRH